MISSFQSQWFNRNRCLLRTAIKLALCFTALAFPARWADAAVGTKTSITWNMQGSSNNKWGEEVRGMVSQRFDIIALTEAGLRPGSARLERYWDHPGWIIDGIEYPAISAGYRVQEFQWNGYWLYYMLMLRSSASPARSIPTRNSLAILSRERAHDVFFEGPARRNNGSVGANSRPAFGIQLGTGANAEAWWTFHAGSGASDTPQNDAQNMIHDIANQMVTAGIPTNWAILGDFNRNMLRAGGSPYPSLPAGVRIVRSGRPTRNSGRELDYMATPDPTAGLHADLYGHFSDHYAVQFGTALRAARGEGPIEVQSRDRPGDGTGLCLDVDDQRVVKLARCRSTDLRWTFESDGTIRALGYCLKALKKYSVLTACDGSDQEIFNTFWKRGPGDDDHDPGYGLLYAGGVALSASPHAKGANVVADPKLQADKWTIPWSAGNIKYYPNPNKVLDDTSDHIDIFDNIHRSNQNFTLAADGTIRLSDQCIDITDGNTADGTRLRLFPCTGGWNQQWRVEEVWRSACGGNDNEDSSPDCMPDPDPVARRLVNPKTGKCIDLPNGDTTNSTELVLSTYSGGSNQKWVVPTLPNPPSAHFYVKDGDLQASWHDEFEGVIDAVIDGDRIGVLTEDGHFRVKEGGLDASWTDIHGNNVIQGVLSGNRIGVLTKDGHFWVKEGGLNASWTDQFGDNVIQGLLFGNRIGVVTSDGHFRVKEGDLDAPWTDFYANNIYAIQGVLSDFGRIGVLTKDGTFLVKDGVLNANFDHIDADDVIKGVMSGNRIGVLTKDGRFRVKEGSRFSNWIDMVVVGDGVREGVLSGDRIGVTTNDSHFWVKEGGLDSSNWNDMFGNGVSEGLLSGDRIGVLRWR